jgi:hypothetical protein
MTELRVPSVQHLARNWRGDPAAIARLLVDLAMNPPRFNYNPLYSAVRDLLVLGVSYEQVEQGICRVNRPAVRENFLGVLPLIRDHFDGVSPDFCQTIGKRYYPVGRGLMVPFEPPMIYGVGGQFYFPWFSFWRQNPLAQERLSLFVTLVDEVLMQDPDLETARFQILDFSCSSPKAPRNLTVTDAQQIPRIDERRKMAMLEVFAEGYFRAVAMLGSGLGPDPGNERPGDEPPQPGSDPRQPDLFE